MTDREKAIADAKIAYRLLITRGIDAGLSIQSDGYAWYTKDWIIKLNDEGKLVSSEERK
jgi:hypothetical protein